MDDEVSPGGGPLIGGDAPDEPAEVSHRRSLIGAGLTVGLLVVVFVVIIPQVIDFDSVIEAVRNLEAWQLVLLLVITIGVWVLVGVQLRTTQPKLPVVEATRTMIQSLAIQGTIPGPADAALRFRIAVDGGRTVEEASISVAMMKLYEVITRLMMPAAAVLILAASGRLDIGWTAVVAVAFSVVTIGGLIAIVGSGRLTAAVGRFVERTAAAVLRPFGRGAPAGLSDTLVEVRENARTLASAEGAFGLAAALLVQVVWAGTMTLVMHFGGVDFDALPLSVVWATVAIVYLLPIGPGLTELAYVAIFTWYLGRDSPVLATAIAGVMVFRMYQWLLPVPIGYALLSRYRRQGRR